MKKLRLDLEGLVVESFASNEVPNRRGTVHARSGDGCTTSCSASGMTHCDSDLSDCADTGNRSCFGGCSVLGC